MWLLLSCTYDIICSRNNHEDIGGEPMELIISQIRWPAEVYKQVKERAYQERKSVNKMVVELVLKELAKDKKVG